MGTRRDEGLGGEFAVDALGGGGLGLDHRFVDQHDGNVVFHWIDAVALRALQALGILAVLERLLAGRADQNLQKVFVDHDK